MFVENRNLKSFSQKIVWTLRRKFITQKIEQFKNVITSEARFILRFNELFSQKTKAETWKVLRINSEKWK